MTQIGLSDLDVYPLCLGANTFGWTSDEKESVAVLDEYYDAGGNFVDTADSYSVWVPGHRGGESERIIGKWLSQRGNRDQLVIATKMGKLAPLDNLQRSSIRAAAEDSLKNLETDYIDLYYAHIEDLEVPIEESVAAFAELVDEGKVREIGLSNHSPARIREWMACADDLGVNRPVALQPHYNLLWRADYEERLRPVAEEYDLAVMPYWALASGLLTGKYRNQEEIQGVRAGMVTDYLTAHTFETLAVVADIAANHNVDQAAVAIAWLSQQPTVTAPIASARVPLHLPPLLEGISIVLSDQELGLLDSLSTKADASVG